MAIEFDCPHCKTHYRLKDEFGGKTATCKTPDCRKVIPIPKPTGPVMSAAPADLDAIAAAAFAEEAAKANKPAEEMIPVTCSGCDHTWSVEASKEGKNVRCPECGKVIRVPVRKKDEKADWRTGGGGPSLAKRETGLDREGAFGNVAATGISEGTAREIVKGREAEEEPEERRKRRLKWGVRIVAGLAVVGAGVYFALKTGREIKSDANMAQAVKEQKEQGSKDPRFEGDGLDRASAEYRARMAGSADEAKGRSRTGSWPATSSVAPGRAEGAAGRRGRCPGRRGRDDPVLPRHGRAGRTRLQEGPGGQGTPADVAGDFGPGASGRRDPRRNPRVRPARVTDAGRGVAHQRGDSNELMAQIGLALLRVNREQYKANAEAILKGNADSPGLQALRAGSAAGQEGGRMPPAPSLVATAEADGH